MRLGPKKKHVGRQVWLFSGFEKFGDFATYFAQKQQNTLISLSEK